MASLDSQRHMVVSLTVRQLAGDGLNRDDDAGGKAGWPPVVRLLFKAGPPFSEEAFAPLADAVSGGIQPSGDLIVVETLGGVENDLGPDDMAIG